MATSRQHSRPTVGLVLGAGAARGWAHIGVIEALEEQGVPIDIVCGCSSGALVAASYATGRFSALADLARSLTLPKVAGYFDFSLDGGGLIEGRNVLKFFEKHVEDVAIERAATRFGAVAAELPSGRETWFTEGSIIDAIRASIALPGLLTPINIKERWLVDGVLVNPLPISLCRSLGADVIIAVNLGGDLLTREAPAQPGAATGEAEQTSSWLSSLREYLPLDLGHSDTASPSLPRPKYFDVLAQSFLIMHNFVTRVRLAADPVDVLLSPQVDQIGLLDFHRAETAIAAGRACVENSAEFTDLRTTLLAADT